MLADRELSRTSEAKQLKSDKDEAMGNQNIDLLPTFPAPQESEVSLPSSRSYSPRVVGARSLDPCLRKSFRPPSTGTHEHATRRLRAGTQRPRHHRSGLELPLDPIHLRVDVATPQCGQQGPRAALLRHAQGRLGRGVVLLPRGRVERW